MALSRSFPAPTSRAIFPLPPLPTGSNSRSFCDAGPAEPEICQPKKRRLPYRHSKEDVGTDDDAISNMHFSSSDGFNPDHDTLSIMEYITMADSSSRLSAQLPPTHEKLRSSDDEDFITPPTSPRLIETKTECLIDPQLKSESENDRARVCIQQADRIQLPQFSSRKRPFPEAPKPPFPRKASRGETTTQPPKAYNVNSLKPAPSYNVEDPFDDITVPSRLMINPGLSRSSTSFDSVGTAATTTTASSIAWSASRSYASGSSLTTPSTSFLSDSMIASFTSNNDSFYNSEVTRSVTVPSAIPESNPTVRSAPNTPRAKRRNGPLQRAATTSNAEAQADDADPMDIDMRGFDRRQEVFSELLGTPNVGKKASATNSDVDCLPNSLRFLPLLRMSTY